jgi:adenylate kinase family enzyme
MELFTELLQGLGLPGLFIWYLHHLREESKQEWAKREEKSDNVIRAIIKRHEEKEAGWKQDLKDLHTQTHEAIDHNSNTFRQLEVAIEKHSAVLNECPVRQDPHALSRMEEKINHLG